MLKKSWIGQVVRKVSTVVAVAAISVAMVGCVGDGHAGEALKPSLKDEITGNVATDGSTSMAKVIGTLGEAFVQINGGVNFTYNPTGSSSGIKAVAEGRCDIGLSSRMLKEEEKAEGLEGTVLALDGIAVIVHNDNPIQDLTAEDIARIFTEEVKNWKEVGGPDLEIVLIGREAGSGTRDGFESITGTKDRCRYRQELTSTGDVVTTVSQNVNAVGYASVASVKSTVKALKIGGVEASEKNIKDGSYPIQRPYVLVTKKGIPLSDAAQAFFDYITSEEAEEIIARTGVFAP